MVVRGHEGPHTHPDGDLVMNVLKRGGRGSSFDRDNSCGSSLGASWLFPKASATLTTTLRKKAR